MSIRRPVFSTLLDATSGDHTRRNPLPLARAAAAQTRPRKDEELISGGGR